jgi:hypothetical protein
MPLASSKWLRVILTLALDILVFWQAIRFIRYTRLLSSYYSDAWNMLMLPAIVASFTNTVRVLPIRWTRHFYKTYEWLPTDTSACSTKGCFIAALKYCLLAMILAATSILAFVVAFRGPTFAALAVGCFTAFGSVFSLIFAGFMACHGSFRY